eukprot:921790-Amphidinium_carterae.1
MGVLCWTVASEQPWRARKYHVRCTGSGLSGYGGESPSIYYAKNYIPQHRSRRQDWDGELAENGELLVHVIAASLESHAGRGME